MFAWLRRLFGSGENNGSSRSANSSQPNQPEQLDWMRLRIEIDGKAIDVDVMATIDPLLAIERRHGIEEVVLADEQSHAYLADVADYVRKTYDVRCDCTAAFLFHSTVGQCYSDILDRIKKKQIASVSLRTGMESTQANGQSIKSTNGMRG